LKNWQLITEPKISGALLTNPGIGFIAAPRLMNDHAEVRDNRGSLVRKYKFSPDQKTWNHPDSGLSYAGASWNALEPEESVYDWTVLDEKLEKAKMLGCNAVVRCSPYSLTEDIPAWLRERYPEDPEFPFWRIDPNTTDFAFYWERFVRAFAARYDGHPFISSVDMALCGAWGEGAGSEFVEEKKLDGIIRAYIEGFTVTPLQCLLHDPVSVGAILKYRKNVGFRVDCLGDMGGFHGKEWSHMQDYYPMNIENFNMHDAWEKGTVVFEACWHMNDWYLSGWDIDYIIEESLKWHISSYNGKQTTVPIEWRDAVAKWVKKMGYRFELRRAYAAAENGSLRAKLLWCNTGVAPCYKPYPLLLKLKNAAGEHTFMLSDDIRAWLPDEDHLSVCEFPTDLPQGEYELSVAIDTGVREIGTLNLAIEGRNAEGFYPLGILTLN
jgi:hypothetical protein